MAFQIKIIVRTSLLIFFYLSITSESIFSQDKYNFDFSTEWKWEDLINKAVLINPNLLKSIDDLKNKVSIEDGRKIFFELSKLELLKNISELNEISKSDFEGDKLMWDSILFKELKDFVVTEDFSGLILTTLKLTDIRNRNKGDKFDFKNREYLLQPSKKVKEGIEIYFNYDGAEKVLDFFKESSDVESNMNDIFNTESYHAILNEKCIENISKNEFESLLKESMNRVTLHGIYKWVNPQSYLDFGGVSVYKNSFENVINTIKSNEKNITADVTNHVSQYLPDSTFFKIDIAFLFGKNIMDCNKQNEKLEIVMENFGDNYEYLTGFIIHNIFKIAQKEIQLPVEFYLVNKNERPLIELLTKMLETGAANYVGPLGAETRPWYLLEKDFEIFNETFEQIYSHKENKLLLDSLINSGFAGDAPFYTMTTQMAYIIETTLGRLALTESIKLGPIFFFNKYIKTYSEYPDKIRKVFRFTKKFENKISELKKLFPDKIINDALNIKKSRKDLTEMNYSIPLFFDKYNKSENEKLIDFLCGQLYLEAGDYPKAKEYFLNGLEKTTDNGVIAGKIGESFFYKNAFNEALEFFNMYVDENPQDAKAFEIKGECFYKMGDIENAKKDFENALILNFNSERANLYLIKINGTH